MLEAFVTRRGGTDGLSPNNAVIHVTAPAGSTISFSKGGVTAKVLGPEKSHVNANDATLADWYYSVSSNNYGTWTVTASLDGSTTNESVVIDSNEQYDVHLKYDMYFIENGIIKGFSYSVSSGITITQNYESSRAVRIYHAKPSSASWYYIVFTPGHDFFAHPYNTLHIDYQIVSSGYNGAHAQNLAGVGSSALNDNYAASVALSNQNSSVSRNTRQVDVSNIASTQFFKYRGCADSTLIMDVRLFNVWLS